MSVDQFIDKTVPVGGWLPLASGGWPVWGGRWGWPGDGGRGRVAGGGWPEEGARRGWPGEGGRWGVDGIVAVGSSR